MAKLAHISTFLRALRIVPIAVNLAVIQHHVVLHYALLPRLRHLQAALERRHVPEVDGGRRFARPPVRPVQPLVGSVDPLPICTFTCTLCSEPDRPVQKFFVFDVNQFPNKRVFFLRVNGCEVDAAVFVFCVEPALSFSTSPGLSHEVWNTFFVDNSIEVLVATSLIVNSPGRPPVDFASDGSGGGGRDSGGGGHGGGFGSRCGVDMLPFAHRHNPCNLSATRIIPLTIMQLKQTLKPARQCHLKASRSHQKKGRKKER